uniref:Endo-1,4-beta-glucanase n=1 Tax=Solanum tuberosum TaxID=4113 RepID=M1CY13_SOLTU
MVKFMMNFYVKHHDFTYALLHNILLILLTSNEMVKLWVLIKTTNHSVGMTRDLKPIISSQRLCCKIWTFQAFEPS